MPINKCRVCSYKLFEEPLMRYENMPKSAQYLPDAESLENDKGVELKVYQCSGCGLVQLSNDPVPYYKEVIRAAAFSAEMEDFRRKQFSNFAENILENRKEVLLNAFEKNPKRFRFKKPKLKNLPKSVWINKPYNIENKKKMMLKLNYKIARFYLTHTDIQKN